MILVTRYLLVSRVENDVNNDLRSSLLGSDNISSSYKLRMRKSVRFQANLGSTEDILCYLGVMSAIKASDSRSEKRFLSQENSSGPIK